MRKKILFRFLIFFTATAICFLSFHTFLQWEMVLNHEVSFSLPAAVYLSSDQNLQFSYADIFHISTDFLEDSEIEYHVDLLTDRTNIHGYVEVWNLEESLSVFLEKTKAAFSPTVKNFQESFPDNDYNNRIWEYEVADGIHVKQYFSQQKEKLIVVSLFAPISLWSKKYETLFEEIQNSITLHGAS